MAAIISSNFRSLNAAAFVGDVTGDKTNIYIGLGKSSPWASTLAATVDTDAPTPQDTLDAINEARQQLIGMKLVNSTDVSHVVPRHDWVAGAEFVAWDSTDPAIYDKAFYCLTPDFKVYKCIAAPASGGVSDVPTHTDAAITKTDDNYYWKYMYTMLATDSEKFLTNSFMPVKTVTEQTKSVGTTTSSSAIITLTEANPFIQVGQIVSGTSSSVTASQTVVSVSGKTVTLSANANAAVADATFTFGNFAADNPLFSQQQSQLTSRALGTAQGIERLKLTTAGTSYPTNGSGVTIAVTGDGTGCSIPNNINAAYIDSNGAFVSDIIITGSNASSGTDVPGTNYSVAQATVTTTGTGSGAVFTPIIAPRGRPGFSTASTFGGHGVDPVFELGGFFVGINVQISGTTDSAIANTQDFRQISLIKNPLINGEIPTSPASAVNTLKYIKYGAEGGTAYDSKGSTLATAVQTADHIIENTTSGFKGFIVNVDTTAKKIYYFQNDLTGYVVPTDAAMVIKTGGSEVSGLALATSDQLTVHDADGNFNEGSGEFLFLENRDPIQRSTSQIEDVKLIIEF